MKNEYEEGKNRVGNNSMFGKIHQQKLQQLQHLMTRECQQTSEEDESRCSGGGAAQKTTKAEGNNGDGATIEVVRRPRGRPPGSKNKAKPPVIITRDAESAMRPHVLEVPGGVDVVDAIARFARQRNIGVCVLTGSGTVANVTLRQPSTNPGATVTFHGRFDILSISATFLPPSSSVPSSVTGFSISLAGPQGQIVGGSVAGSLLAAGTVVVVAATFTNPSYHRLCVEDKLANSVSGDGGQSPLAASSGGEGSHPPPAESCGMSIYGCHVPSDVIWAPTARQAPPPPHL